MNTHGTNGASSVSPMDGGILLQEESKEEWEQRMREAEEQRKLNRCVLFACNTGYHTSRQTERLTECGKTERLTE